MNRGCFGFFTKTHVEVAYAAWYRALPNPQWLMVTNTGALATRTPTAVTTTIFNVDHIVEIETIVNYFTADWASTIGLSPSQWGVIVALFEDQGGVASLGVSIANLVDIR